MFPSTPRVLRLPWSPLRLITVIPADVPRCLQRLLKIRWIIVCYWAPSHSWEDLISTVSAPCCVWPTSGVCHQGQLPFSLKELDALQLFPLTWCCDNYAHTPWYFYLCEDPPPKTHTHRRCLGLTTVSSDLSLNVMDASSHRGSSTCTITTQTVREDRRAQSGAHATVCSNIQLLYSIICS